ncbi:MAG: o-succinylbenzoate--CoA ligase, partial [Chlamydiota bacterium]
ERALETIDGVYHAQVIPIPDREFGYRPLAYVENKKKYRTGELKRRLSRSLPKFKVPVTIISFYKNR